MHFINGPPNRPVLFCLLASVVVCNSDTRRVGGQHCTVQCAIMAGWDVIFKGRALPFEEYLQTYSKSIPQLTEKCKEAA